jgi:predicted transcriptional regulator of viral defense system
MVQNMTGLLLRKLRLDKKSFITDNYLKEYCKIFELDYTYITNYYLRKGIFLRIFRGVFYVKSAEEIEMRLTNYNHMELVSRGLEMKGVMNWYFGLYTALKLNEMTHEYFTSEDVISGTIFRMNPVTIADHKFRFTKLSPKLTSFGINRKKTAIKSTYMRYSDPEKTILDFIYLWRYEGLLPSRIKMQIRDWSIDLNSSKLEKYAQNYPKTVRNIVLEEFR